MQTSLSQQVRIAVARIQATQHDRPVSLARLAREIPHESLEIEAALRELEQLRIVHQVGDGWLTRPPPVPMDATHARADASRLHLR